MFELDISSEPIIRLSVFLGVLSLMICLEWMIPRRNKQFRLKRWPSNLGLVFFNTLTVRVLLPGATVAVALWANKHGLGLLNVFQPPAVLSIILAVTLLDLTVYWQHRFSHMVPMLWKVHRLHHVDTMIDVTTGSRFHPIEIVLSVLVKLVVIVLLGAPAWAVIIFEVLLNATAMFNHSNIYLPAKIDTIVRRVFVTPDMHRVHHSIHPNEHHQNFGFNLSLWDYWFKSYTAQPKDGHLDMQIGLTFFREPKETSLLKMLTQPFRDPNSTQ